MKNIIPIALLILLAACASVKRSSSFTTETIKPGMTTEQVVARHGKPYKESFIYDDYSKVRTEEYYYKEHIYRKVWYEITVILHFKNNSLVSVEQGEEKRMDDNVIVNK